jgi:serine/threonine-protein kinase HipA
MNDITHCPGTLAEGYSTYSRKCLTKMFKGKKVDHILAYDSPLANADVDELFDANRKRISISGVQEKFSVLLEKNRLRLATDGEQGEYILKPIPAIGKRLDQMPANEHLTMQIAKQVFKIETAENALVFFKNGEAAYLTKRFDLVADGSKLAQEDFASLAKRTPQTHGDNYKYAGNYLELFNLLRNSVTAYLPEASKLLRLIIFNYLFSNGDAHFKNFSLIETALGDFKLSPAYDLLNSRIHIEDQTFALSDGLLPRHLAQGKVIDQFKILAKEADIKSVIFDKILKDMLSGSEQVEKLIFSSFLDKKTQRNYWQSYLGRLKQLKK